MEDAEHGAPTGSYSFSRGVGRRWDRCSRGPAIGLTADVFSATHGFQATWGVCAAAILLSLVPLRRLRRLRRPTD